MICPIAARRDLPLDECPSSCDSRGLAGQALNGGMGRSRKGAAPAGPKDGIVSALHNKRMCCSFRGSAARSEKICVNFAGAPLLFSGRLSGFFRCALLLLDI